MEDYMIKKIEKILLFFVGVSLPLINLRLDLGFYTMSLYMTSIIILFVYVAITNGKNYNQRPMTINRKEILVFIFFIIFCFSIFYSPNIAYGLDKFVKLALVAIFYLFIKFIFIKKPYYLNYIINYSLASLSIYMGYLIYKYIFVFNETYLGVNTEYATGSGKNSLAFMVCILLAFILGNITTVGIFKHKIITNLMYLVIIISIFLIQSRGLFLVFLVYILLSFAMKRKKTGFNIKTISLVLIGIIIVIFVLPDDITISVVNRFSGLLSVFDKGFNIEDLSASRAALIYRGIDLFSLSPLFGVGAGGFIYYNGIYQISHNDYLLVFTEQGLIGIIIFISILISYLFTAYKIYRIEPSSINKGIFFSIVGIMIYLLFINAYDSILFWSVLAMISAKETSYKNQKYETKLKKEE